MTKKSMVKYLIIHYEEAIAWYKKTQDYRVIIDFSINKGICHCMLIKFNEYAEDHWYWINKYTEIDSYWYETPSIRNSFEQNLECLTKRLEILNQIYAQDESLNEQGQAV